MNGILLQEKLAWLERHQPRNLQAINALRRKMGAPTVPKPHKPKAHQSRPVYPFSKGYIQRQMRDVTIHY